MLHSPLALGDSQLVGLFCLLWGGAMLLAFLHLPDRIAARLRRQSVPTVVTAIAGIALLVRGVPNVVLPVGASYDIESYGLVADSVLNGQDVYTNPGSMDRHPYLPLQMYWMAAARLCASWAGLAYVKVVRLAPILADAVISVLVYVYLARRHPRHRAISSGLLYALNPVAVFVSAFHGQFDAVPLLFLLLSVTSHRRSWVGSSLLLGVGILNKSWPVLGLPSLVWHVRGLRNRVAYALSASIVPAIGLLAYAILFRAQPRAVIDKAIGYNWGVGAWGYTYLLRLLGVVLPDASSLLSFAVHSGRFVTLAVLALTWVLHSRRQDLANGVLTLLVAFFAGTHAFSIQYLVWLLPWALVCLDYRWLRRYTLAATAYMLLVYSTLILASHVTMLMPWPQADWFIIMPSGLPAWLVTVGWAVSRWRRGCVADIVPGDGGSTP